MINLTDSFQEPLTSDEERLLYEMIDVVGNGVYEDNFKIEDAPDDIHYEWHQPTATNVGRLLKMGFKRDDELAKKSPNINSPDDPRIIDVACFSVPRRRHIINQTAINIAKAKRADPRKDTNKLAAELTGISLNDFENLPPVGTNAPVDSKDILRGDAVQIALKEAIATSETLNR